VAAGDAAINACRIRRFMSGFFDAASDPDVVAAEQAFITRQALLRSWGELALPVGIQDDLPQAAQVIGPRYREDLIDPR
jgi:hypothetical protein